MVLVTWTSRGQKQEYSEGLKVGKVLKLQKITGILSNVKAHKKHF